MNMELINYDYSRKFLFIENESNYFKKELDDSTEINNVNYQWKLVNSITRKKHKGIIYDLIQHEDFIIGWIELKESPQVFRFPSKQCKIVDEIYFDNQLNKNMGKTRNYKILFKDKVLSARCEVEYDNQVYYGIFLNGQFQGFHNEEIVDFHIPLDATIDVNPKETVLYKISNLTLPIENKVTRLNITGVFKKNGIGKVKINDQKAPYWLDISSYINNINIPNKKEKKEEKILNDIFEFIKLERKKSKEIANKILEVRDYLVNLEDEKKI